MEALALNNTAQIIPLQVNGGTIARFTDYLDASPKTVETYKRNLRQFANYLSFNGITQPAREDVIAFREYLKAEGYKPSTVQNYITAVRLFFAWTASQGIYPNVADHIKGAKLDRNHKKDSLTASQIKSILQNMNRETEQEKRDYAILVLMVTGGLRTIEVSRANIEDLGSVGEYSVLYLQGKGREERTEYTKLAPAVEDAIRDYLKARGAVQDDEPLFTSTSNNSTGQRLTTRTISGIVKRAFVQAGYNSERLTAHSTRHTAVTLALLSGQTIQEVQQFARHKNVATTLIYAHNLDKANNQCSNAIADAIF